MGKKSSVAVEEAAVMSEDINVHEMVGVDDSIVETRMKRVTPRSEEQEEEYYEERQSKRRVVPASCLRNEKVKVRYIPRESHGITNKKHVFYGGMSNNAFVEYCVPRFDSTGTYKNVLTNDEKAFLEEYMVLEPNTLSVHKKKDNYWNGKSVRLYKQDTSFDLSNPDDYIRYKILLANNDYIADSLETLQNQPKQTYRFVIIREDEHAKQQQGDLNINARAYMTFGKMQDEPAMLALVIETINMRPISYTTKLLDLQSQINGILRTNPKMFLATVEDPLFKIKVTLRECIHNGLVYKKGTYHYLKATGEPLCEPNQDPVFTVSAKYLSLPKQQPLLFELQDKLKQIYANR